MATKPIGEESPAPSWLTERDHQKLVAVFQSKNATFSDLARQAGLDPKTSFRRVNLSGVNFSGSDLRGFNFSEANLTMTNWKGSIYDTSTIIDGADLTGARGRTVINEPARAIQRLGLRNPIQSTMSAVAAGYVLMVGGTTRWIVKPLDFQRQLIADLPVIFAMWHGQHFLFPIAVRHFSRETNFPVSVLIGRQSDGNVIADAAQRIGMTVIRGGGSPNPHLLFRKGGALAFRSMMRALEARSSVALTADVPKISRLAGIGCVKLAQGARRPIYPLAIATSRRIELSNWDRSVVSLPFGTGAVVFGSKIEVPADADGDVIEASRIEVEKALNEATALAYSTVDRN
jgi:lysophospholipid acyltransferase (LPLAT)-like uncharacterized protein